MFAVCLALLASSVAETRCWYHVGGRFVRDLRFGVSEIRFLVLYRLFILITVMIRLAQNKFCILTYHYTKRI